MLTMISMSWTSQAPCLLCASPHDALGIKCSATCQLMFQRACRGGHAARTLASYVLVSSLGRLSAGARDTTSGAM